MMGLKQSGLPNYRFADPFAHADLIRAAHDDARLILNRDPDLQSPRGQALRMLIELLISQFAGVRNLSLRAVIWDFGGVFTTSPFEAFNRYEAARGLPHNLIRTINAANPHTNAWAKFERSEISASEFDTLFAEEATALGHQVRGADILPLLSGDIRPNVVAALKDCKAKYKVGCITNNVSTGSGAGMAGTAEKAKAVAEIMTLFDHVIESSK
eukprot:gene21578-16046_t